MCFLFCSWNVAIYFTVQTKYLILNQLVYRHSTQWNEFERKKI